MCYRVSRTRQQRKDELGATKVPARPELMLDCGCCRQSRVNPLNSCGAPAGGTLECGNLSQQLDCPSRGSGRSGQPCDFSRMSSNEKAITRRRQVFNGAA